MDNEKTPPQSSAQSPHLHGEIIEEEILSRLPVKSLLRFRCVSKPWRSLITSKRFIKIHLKNYTYKQTYDKRRKIFHCKKHGLNQLSEQSLDLIPFDDPKNIHLMPGTIVDYCNGLLCIHKFPGCFFLWNPATRNYIMLPEIALNHLQIKKWGFGWCVKSGAYKVFVGMSNRNGGEKIGLVCSSKTGSWKKLEQVGNLSLRRISGRVALGMINWVTESGDIETFDLESEEFGMIRFETGRGEIKKLDLKSVDVERFALKSEEFGMIQRETTGMSVEKRRCCLPFVYNESLVSPLDEVKRQSVSKWLEFFQ